jgi:hypothetical protein
MTDAHGTLDRWRALAGSIRARVAGLADEDLDHRPAPDAMTLRETVHHLTEAQVVAASIVTAALGSPGSVYDWHWMMPFGDWMERLRYDRKPIGPALDLLDALGTWVAAQIEPLADGLAREVRLRDAPDAELRTVTVAEVLEEEIEHARHHLGA